MVASLQGDRPLCANRRRRVNSAKHERSHLLERLLRARVKHHDHVIEVDLRQALESHRQVAEPSGSTGTPARESRAGATPW